jgi:hypothetical protein
MRHRVYRTCAAATGALVIAGATAALRADSGPCTYGLPSVTSDLAATGGTVSIVLVTQTGCAWTATTDSAGITQMTPAAASDSATVEVTVAANPDPAPRLLNVTLGDSAVGTVLYVVSQRGTSCTFAIAKPPSLVPAAGGTGSFRISTQPGCGWSVSATDSFVSFPEAAGVADSNGLATIAYRLDPNTGASDTRRTSITVTNLIAPVNSAFTLIAQGADGSGPVPSWNVGDVFAGIGSWFSNAGLYRTLSPTGAPDLKDAYGGTTTGCAVDPNVAHGDLFTTSWDGLLISRFSAATHRLVSALDLTPAGLATVQRATGTVPVPSTQNLDMGIPWPDFTYSEQLVFDQSGNFFVGGSMYETESFGLGHAYLLKFAKNDTGSIPGCAAKSPCLLDWWRVDAAGEAPTGQNPAGTNAQWTALYKSAYLATAGDSATRTAAARAAVAPLAASLSYQAGTPPQLPAPAGVDELDLSSDQHTVFYTSEDNRIRRFDTATGQQLTPLTITDPDTHQSYHGKAYGFRLLPDGSGQADGGAGMIVAMSIGIFRLDATGSAIKLAGANDIIQYKVDPGASTPFSMNLTPDAQSFWVATTQNDSSQPTPTGGKIYRFHIPTGRRYGPFNVGTGGADIDIQGLCVKREFTAGVNQCFKTDKDGKGVLDASGNPIAIACRNPTTCLGLGIDAARNPNADCYPPGEAPLTNRAPVCSTAAPSQALWPPNHKFVDVTVKGVTDPDGDPVTIKITSIWQDEPVTAQGSGNTSGDASGVGTSDASVRAERTGVKATPGDGRIYQINFAASDGMGGSCTGAIEVGIPHDQGLTSMPSDSGLRYDSLTGTRMR